MTLNFIQSYWFFLICTRHFQGLNAAVDWFWVMICNFEWLKSFISLGFFYFFPKSWISHLLPGFRMSTLAKNVPQVVYYQTQVDDFGAIFVRTHQLAHGLWRFQYHIICIIHLFVKKILCLTLHRAAICIKKNIYGLPIIYDYRCKLMHGNNGCKKVTFCAI